MSLHLLNPLFNFIFKELFMSKLHEVLAVEADLEGKAKRIAEEAVATFKSKAHLFSGKVRTLQLFKGDDDVSRQAAEQAERQEQLLVTTVPDKLKYVWESLISHWDSVAQKEATNQTAKGDVIVNGTSVLSNVPVTFLLSLESKLRQLRGLYEVIPTLEPNINWQPAPDIDPNVRRSPETAILKTAKATDFRTVAPATDKHQAQVVQVEKTDNVGVYKTTTTSGMVTPAQKSEWLGRIDTLLRAVKQARQRANEAELVPVNFSESLLRYIHGSELDNSNGQNSSV
jgi:hypothetical protein